MKLSLMFLVLGVCYEPFTAVTSSSVQMEMCSRERADISGLCDLAGGWSTRMFTLPIHFISGLLLDDARLILWHV